MTDLRADHLAALAKMQDAHNMIMSGATKVAEGGVEGIRDAAESEPELLLAAINALVALADMQWKQILSLEEDWMEMNDKIDSIINEE